VLEPPARITANDRKRRKTQGYFAAIGTQCRAPNERTGTLQPFCDIDQDGIELRPFGNASAPVIATHAVANHSGTLIKQSAIKGGCLFFGPGMA